MPNYAANYVNGYQALVNETTRIETLQIKAEVRNMRVNEVFHLKQPNLAIIIVCVYF